MGWAPFFSLEGREWFLFFSGASPPWVAPDVWKSSGGFRLLFSPFDLGIRLSPVMVFFGLAFSVFAQSFFFSLGRDFAPHSHFGQGPFVPLGALSPSP